MYPTIHIYYTYEVIFEPIKRKKLEFFLIDEDFNPAFDFSQVGEEEVFLYQLFWSMFKASGRGNI